MYDIKWNLLKRNNESNVFYTKNLENFVLRYVDAI